MAVLGFEGFFPPPMTRAFLGLSHLSTCLLGAERDVQKMVKIEAYHPAASGTPIISQG